MIQIHRQKRLITIDAKRVSLTPTEHRLVTALGMMDNKVVARELLLDALCEDRVRIPDDDKVLSLHICRLKKKLGDERLQVKKQIGYSLTGEVKFVG